MPTTRRTPTMPDSEAAASDHAEHAAAPHGDEQHDDDDDDGEEAEEEVVESVGGDDVMEEVPERAFRPRRQYKIQEVIKRRQVMLVQVVKEERGNKGAALTTYLSLAGRYAVLMPNTARGGGISRKITSAQDRSRLKEVVQDLDVPEGMGIILRTAGASRTKPEIKRDFEYLIRMWETVRDMTLKSQAPTLVYEEGSLIKRSLRDLYNKEIDEIQVAGEAGYQEARDFMKMLMPSNVRAVRQYRDGQPLFSRMGVESQLDAMFSPTVQLRSGGYIVINQTEALVSIDVNSGRSTREHHIEDTALKTNLEAAEEVARQLRLRDLAGLIVIDFIDMDEKRNNRSVERKLSDCLRQDRARIQVGRISHFGLLEMSRQRIRASVLESSTEPCPQCGGSGHVRSVSSVALQLLRGLEEILMKGATHNLVVRTRTDVALYVLNHKRGHLRDLENSFKVTLCRDRRSDRERPAVVRHRSRRTGAYAGGGQGAAGSAGRGLPVAGRGSVRRGRAVRRRGGSRNRGNRRAGRRRSRPARRATASPMRMVTSASGGGGGAAVPARRAKAAPRATTTRPRALRRTSWPPRMRLAMKAKPTRKKPTISPARRAPIRQPMASGGRAGADAAADAAGAADRKTVWPDRSRTNSDRHRFRKQRARSPISTAPRPNPRCRWFSPNPSHLRPSCNMPIALRRKTAPALAQEETAQEAERAARRRSTVREKVSFLVDAQPAAAATPVTQSQPEPPAGPLPRPSPRRRQPATPSPAAPDGGRGASATANKSSRSRETKNRPAKPGGF